MAKLGRRNQTALMTNQTLIAWLIAISLPQS